MAKMKWDAEFNDEELDGIEYDPETEGGFTPYDGPIPPSNTLLSGIVKKAWATTSKNTGKPMLKVLWVAEGNEGEKKKYEGLPIWHYVVFTKESAFSWKPFLAAFELTASDIKNKMSVEPDEDGTNGKVILKIGAKFKPGEKTAKVNVLTKREKYNDEDQARIAKFLLAVGDSDGDDEEDDLPF